MATGELLRTLAAEPGRRLAIDGTMNFRDVGGYPVAGGGQIGWRLLFRSDALHLVDAAAAVRLRALGLRTVIDLRTAYEAELAPSPLDELGIGGAVRMHISLIGEDLTGLPADLGAIYDYMIDRRGAAIGVVVRCLARPGGLPALVHCSAGKDRTGLMIALILAAIGVPDPVIVADYSLTRLFLDPEHTPTIGLVRRSTGLGDQLTAELLASPPEVIQRTLVRARQQAGTVAGYLARHGVTAAELDALAAALIGSGGSGDEAGDSGGARRA